jgi:hypothetical protein
MSYSIERGKHMAILAISYTYNSYPVGRGIHPSLGVVD